MDLKAYLATAPRGAAADLARVVGVHPVTVSQWASGLKAVAVGRCVPIELATAGTVRRQDLRPDDWHRIWPELIGTDGAPEAHPAPLAAPAASIASAPVPAAAPVPAPAAPVRLMTPAEAALRVRDAHLNAGGGVSSLPQTTEEARDAA